MSAGFVKQENEYAAPPRGILILHALVMGVILFAYAFVAPGQENQPEGTAAISQPRIRQEMLVTTNWLATHLHEPGTIVIHVSTDRTSYDEGHIPGAFFVSWDQVAVTRDRIPNELPPLQDFARVLQQLGVGETSRIVLYDDESGLRAARAYVAFDYAGLGDRTALLDGQLKRWKAEKRTLSKAVPKSEPSRYVPRPCPATIIHLQSVRDAVWAESLNAPVALIDARPAEQYTGKEPGEDIERPGHIPGAISIPWTRAIVSEETPLLLGPERLQSLYSDAGIKPEDLVVTYCRTGGQASHAYFVARYLGYETAMYDGSFYEWSRQRDTTVVTGTAPHNRKMK